MTWISARICFEVRLRKLDTARASVPPPTTTVTPHPSPPPNRVVLNNETNARQGVYAYGFERPSAIQQRAIKPIIMGRDVIAQSQVTDEA